MTLLVATHPMYLEHDSGHGHPERPERLAAVTQGLADAGLDDAVAWVEPTPASTDAIERVHATGLVANLERFCADGGGFIDADTHVGRASFEAARLAAGAGLELARRLDAGEGDTGFCVVRPPGHHATPSRAMGFCLFNNVAITAAALADRGERVAIVDYDAHHGNGTQDTFISDGRVFYVSFHEWPLYPGTGRLSDVGEGKGLGTTLNLPLPAGTTGDVYRRALDDLVLPALEAFSPTWLLISAGFDGHRADPLTGLGLTSGDYGDITRALLPLVPAGRRMLLLEGGYDLDALRTSTGAALGVTQGVDFRPEPATAGGPGDDVLAAALKIRRSTADG